MSPIGVFDNTVGVTPDVGVELLAHMRAATNSDVAFETPPEQIVGGFDTTIFSFQLAGAPPPFDVPLILRLYRREREEGQARFEAAVQSAVAAQGFEAPPILSFGGAGDGFGQPFAIMPRLPGRTMLDAMFSHRLFSVARLMGGAHARLHELDVGRFAADVRVSSPLHEDPQPMRDLEFMEPYLDRLELDGLRPGFEWLRAHAPVAELLSVVCHGDFHPLNILVQGGRLSGVIDWTNARIAPAEYDVGATVALFSHGPVALPGFLQGPVNFLRRRAAASYLREYSKRRPLDPEATRYFEALRSMGFLVEACEWLRAQTGAIAPMERTPAFVGTRTLDGVRKRLRAITGVEVWLPEPV